MKTIKHKNNMEHQLDVLPYSVNNEDKCGVGSIKAVYFFEFPEPLPDNLIGNMQAEPIDYSWKEYYEEMNGDVKPLDESDYKVE